MSHREGVIPVVSVHLFANNFVFEVASLIGVPVEYWRERSEAALEAKKKTERWTDHVTPTECPTLEARGESFRNWEAALVKLLKKRGAPLSFTMEPGLHDALAQNHHRNIALVMYKTIYESLPPFVYNKRPAVRTFAGLVSLFPTANEAIHQLLAETAAIPLHEANTCVIAHQLIQAKILNADPKGTNTANNNSSYMVRLLDYIRENSSLTLLLDEWRDRTKATAADVKIFACFDGSLPVGGILTTGGVLPGALGALVDAFG